MWLFFDKNEYSLQVCNLLFLDLLRLKQALVQLFHSFTAARTSGLRSVLEMRWGLSLLQPRFHVETARTWRLRSQRSNCPFLKLTERLGLSAQSDPRKQRFNT